MARVAPREGAQVSRTSWHSRSVKRGRPSGRARRNPYKGFVTRTDLVESFHVGDTVELEARGGTWRGTIRRVGDTLISLAGPRGGGAQLVPNIHSSVLYLIVTGRGMPRAMGPVEKISAVQAPRRNSGLFPMGLTSSELVDFVNHGIMHTEPLTSAQSNALRKVLDAYWCRGTATPTDYREVAMWVSAYLKSRPVVDKRPLLRKVARDLWRKAGAHPRKPRRKEKP